MQTLFLSACCTPPIPHVAFFCNHHPQPSKQLLPAQDTAVLCYLSSSTYESLTLSSMLFPPIFIWFLAPYYCCVTTLTYPTEQLSTSLCLLGQNPSNWDEDPKRFQYGWIQISTDQSDFQFETYYWNQILTTQSYPPNISKSCYKKSNDNANEPNIKQRDLQDLRGNLMQPMIKSVL